MLGERQQALQFGLVPWKVRYGLPSLFSQTHNEATRVAVLSEGLNKFPKPAPSRAPQHPWVRSVRVLDRAPLAGDSPLGDDTPVLTPAVATACGHRE